METKESQEGGGQKPQEIEWDGKRIPSENWGKDHLSTLLYFESTVTNGVGNGLGSPETARMRQEPSRPRRGVLSDSYGDSYLSGRRRYGTRLKNKVEVFGHDDWDCADDMEAEGLIEQVGTALQPLIRLTPYGRRCVEALRRHLGENGRTYSNFELPVRNPEERGEG